MIRRGGYGLIGSMGALAMEIIVREIAAGDPRCPYNEEACRTMPIDREYMRDSGYGKTGAAILSALAAAGYAVVPVEPRLDMIGAGVIAALEARKTKHPNQMELGSDLVAGYSAMLAAAGETSNEG